jgi:hypothetical protein
VEAEKNNIDLAIYRYHTTAFPILITREYMNLEKNLEREKKIGRSWKEESKHWKKKLAKEKKVERSWKENFGKR